MRYYAGNDGINLAVGLIQNGRVATILDFRYHIHSSDRASVVATFHT